RNRGTRQDQLEPRTVAAGRRRCRDGGVRLQSGRPGRTVLVACRPTRAQLAALVGHTLLKPDATDADLVALVAEARGRAAYAVSVPPSMVPVAVQAGAGGVRVVAVAGFPSGKHVSAVKALEAAQAVAAGASEIDMVIDVGAALTGDIDAVRRD